MCQQSRVVPRPQSASCWLLGGHHASSFLRAARATSGVRVKAVVTRSNPRPPRFARCLLPGSGHSAARNGNRRRPARGLPFNAPPRHRIRTIMRYYVERVQCLALNPSGGRTMRDVIQDLMYGLRVFRRDPPNRRPRARHRRQPPRICHLLNATMWMRPGVANPIARPRRRRVERRRLTRMVVRRVPRAARHLRPETR